MSFSPNYYYGSTSDVIIYSSVAIHNLTVVYQYKVVNGNANGTILTRTVFYGGCFPSWGPLIDVYEGQVPLHFHYVIPNDIIEVSSTTRPVYNFVGNTASNEWVISPQVNVTEVYGYN